MKINKFLCNENYNKADTHSRCLCWTNRYENYRMFQCLPTHTCTYTFQCLHTHVLHVYSSYFLSIVNSYKVDAHPRYPYLTTKMKIIKRFSVSTHKCHPCIFFLFLL